MGISIRPSSKADYAETENLTREAFWDLFQPGCSEHLVLHQLRESKAFVPELDLVACDGAEIVGNIVYSEASIRNGDSEHTVLCMGPLCVLPARQKQGIGAALLKTSIEKARELGYPAVVIFGDPAYYHHFGFKNASQYDIQTSEVNNLEAFMVRDLEGKGLKAIRGKFVEDQAFQVNKDDLEEFDKQFPYKVKHKKPGQFGS